MTFILRGTYNDEPTTVWRVGHADVESDSERILDDVLWAACGREQIDFALPGPAVTASIDGEDLAVFITFLMRFDHLAPLSILADPKLRARYEERVYVPPGCVA